MINEAELNKLWKSFYLDVTKLTYKLFTLLHGTELVYAGEFPRYSSLSTVERQWSVRSFSGPSYLDLYPRIFGPDILDLMRRGGEVEQLVYRGWIVELYRLWEDRYRRKMQEIFNRYDDSIPPRLTVMGDLRHIRNDIVHGGEKATAENIGKCELFEWFEIDERILFDISHVLDFLHHLGCLKFGFIYTGTESSSWDFAPMNMLLSRDPVPKIVSVRTDLEVHPVSKEIWFLISLVYNNGFFSQHAISTRLSDNSENMTKLLKQISAVKITDNGDLDGPQAWLKARAQDIYPGAVHANFKSNEDENKQEFPKGGFPGPWVQFR